MSSHARLKMVAQISGWSVDKPFPEASKPEKGIIAGKIVEVVTNDFKVAVLVELKDKSVFTVVRGFSGYDPKNKKMYPMANKRKALLAAFNIKDFSELERVMTLHLSVNKLERTITMCQN